jgi:hypothetical protein
MFYVEQCENNKVPVQNILCKAIQKQGKFRIKRSAQNNTETKNTQIREIPVKTFYAEQCRDKKALNQNVLRRTIQEINS